MMKDKLISEHLLLRRFIKEDVFDVFNNWGKDEEVHKYLISDPYEDLSKTEKIIDVWLEEYDSPLTFRYAITLRESNELIGIIEVERIKDNILEIGYLLGKKYWNKGYMSEALAIFINHLKEAGYHTFIAYSHKDNVASEKVLIKNGFKLIKEEKRLFKKKESIIYLFKRDD